MEQWMIDELNGLREFLISRAQDAHKYVLRLSEQNGDENGRAFFAGKVSGIEEAVSELDSWMSIFGKPKESKS